MVRQGLDWNSSSTTITTPPLLSHGWWKFRLQVPTFHTKIGCVQTYSGNHVSSTHPISHYKYDEWLDKVEIGIHSPQPSQHLALQSLLVIISAPGPYVSHQDCMWADYIYLTKFLTYINKWLSSEHTNCTVLRFQSPDKFKLSCMTAKTVTRKSVLNSLVLSTLVEITLQDQ